MIRTIVSALCIVLVAAAGAAGQALDQEFTATPGGVLELDLDAGGTVEIEAWSSSSVQVRAEVSGRDADIVEVSASQTDSGVLVRSDYSERRRSTSSTIRFEIRVPSRFNIELQSVGGGMSVDGVEGEISGKTMGGSLNLTNLAGRLSLTTMGGSVTLTRSRLDGSVKTMGGEVLVEDVVGDVKATSMGGEVTLRNVTRSNGDSTGDQVVISTMGGPITVSEAPSGADVHTMGGNITIDRAQRFVKAKTMGGDIRIGAVSGRVQATTMAGDVDVTVVDGASSGDIELTSMSGEVHLTVPDGFQMALDIELAYTRNSSRRYEITSDFPLSTSSPEEWDYGHGSPRKVISATGTTGAGAHRVVIRTVNGNVSVKRAR